MRKTFLLLASLLLFRTYATPGFSLSGGLNFSPARIKEAESAGSRESLWAYSLQLGYEFSSGFGVGVRKITPCCPIAVKLPTDYASLLGSPVAGIAPRAYLGEFDLPLLSLGSLNCSASVGAGYASWGKENFARLSSQQYALPGGPAVNIEARLPVWTLAYLALINVEVDAMDLVTLRASCGYTSFGSPVNHPALKSVLNGLTFGLGASLKLW